MEVCFEECWVFGASSGRLSWTEKGRWRNVRRVVRRTVRLEGGGY